MNEKDNMVINLDSNVNSKHIKAIVKTIRTMADEMEININNSSYQIFFECKHDVLEGPYGFFQPSYKKIIITMPA